jgi:hypothetical protein
LLNLISNAIKFTEKGGVKVRARLLPEQCLFEVAVIDSGIGISREQQAALFAPFTQADGSITRRYGGTRLGLAISKRLVELLGGSISVASAEGEGSTFTFTAATGSLEDVRSRARSPSRRRLRCRRCRASRAATSDRRRPARHALSHPNLLGGSGRHRAEREQWR